MKSRGSPPISLLVCESVFVCRPLRSTRLVRIGILGKPFLANGGKLIGKCSRDDYEFRESVGLEGDQLLGLGLDYDNEDEKCEDQMIMWLESIMESFQ